MLYTLYGGFGRLSPDWAESWRSTVGASRSRLHWGWREVISLAYEHENFTVAGVDGVTNLLIPSVAYNRTWSTGGSTPRSGTRFRVEARGALENVLSSVTFGTLLAEARRIQPLTARSRLLMRVEAARTFTEDVTSLPPSHRFVTGGDQSIRGYAFESLGPRNADSALVGGDALLTASVEADMTVWRTFGVAAFFDLGNAYGDGFTGGGGIEHGTGVGLRWRSPIGPLRIDFAFATSQPGTPFRIHFSIGPDL
jgi:translocation and assembly module TamA